MLSARASIANRDILHEANPAVGPVDLLLDDEVPAAQFLEGHGLQILVPLLETRAEDMSRARVFVQPTHGGTVPDCEDKCQEVKRGRQSALASCRAGAARRVMASDRENLYPGRKSEPMG
jgi:hypothetical protein